MVKAIRELLPNEDIFYLGDTARVPYGGKSPSTVERYSVEMTDMLIAEDVKAVVIACNSASAVALPKLEEMLPVPVIGVITPGAQAAVVATRNGHIGVIGTRATIKSGAYERELLALDPGVRISVRACPLLVPLIEEGWLEDELTDRVIARYLGQLMHDGIDALVLGCTHYRGAGGPWRSLAGGRHRSLSWRESRTRRFSTQLRERARATSGPTISSRTARSRR